MLTDCMQTWLAEKWSTRAHMVGREVVNQVAREVFIHGKHALQRDVNNQCKHGRQSGFPLPHCCGSNSCAYSKVPHLAVQLNLICVNVMLCVNSQVDGGILCGGQSCLPVTLVPFFMCSILTLSVPQGLMLVDPRGCNQHFKNTHNLFF